MGWYKQKYFKMFTIIIASIVVFEIFALLWLYLSINRNKQFWINKANEQGEIVYLALGDSASQGIGASTPNKGFVGQIGQRIEKKYNKKVKIINLSVTGAKLNDYLNYQAPKIPKIKADIVTIEIGANDIKNFNAKEFRQDFKKVLKTLPDNSYVSNMPLFNSRPSSTEPGKFASKIIEEELIKYPNLNFVDLQKETTANQSIFGFAPDLFHPNDISYNNWANAFWEQIDKNYEKF